MINKRKLDEVIQDVTYDPERHCGYLYEEYCRTPFYQEHVCDFVRNWIMPYILAKYLYYNCYYDDIETVQANIDYINLTMPKFKSYRTWVDMTLDMLLERIEQYKDKEAKEQAEAEARSYDDDLGDLLDKADSTHKNN